jgi:hypothetical protein
MPQRTPVAARQRPSSPKHGWPSTWDQSRYRLANRRQSEDGIDGLDSKRGVFGLETPAHRKVHRQGVVSSLLRVLRQGEIWPEPPRKGKPSRQHQGDCSRPDGGVSRVHRSRALRLCKRGTVPGPERGEPREVRQSRLRQFWQSHA